MLIDEPISIEMYNPAWQADYQTEKGLLQPLFKQAHIEHFGSTAIVDMAAKPIIDILIGLPEWKLSSKQQLALFQLAYQYLGEAGISGRWYYRKRGLKNFNLAIVQLNGELWRNNLAIRDYLRTHPVEAQNYTDFKQALIAKGHNRLLDYSQHKQQILAQILTKALN